MEQTDFVTAAKRTTQRRPRITAADRPDRAGKRMLAAHFEAATFQAVKRLQADELKPINLLLAEALELLFKDRGRPVPPSLKRELRALRDRQPG